MELAVPVILGVIAIIAVSYFARRLGVAAPLLLVLVGVLVSFLPFVAAVEIEPEWILGGILPPLLYSGAVSMPTMDFRRDFKAIGALSVLLVVATAVIVGYVLWWIVPGINLATGIAVGAVLSPTDAVATTIVKKLGVSGRIVTILEGESLLNDASALVILRSATAAIAVTVGAAGASGEVSVGHVALDFVYAVVVAVAVGWVVGKISLALRSRLNDAVLNTAASFVVPFVAYLPAEHLGASGLVAVVVAGLVSGQGALQNLRPQDRRAEESNWRTVELLLEGAVFLLMGLELFGLVENVHDEHESVLVAGGIAGVAFVLLLAVRTVFLVPLLLGLRRDRREAGEQRERLEQFQGRLSAGAPADADVEERILAVRARLETEGRRMTRRQRRRMEQLRTEGPERAEARRSRMQLFVDRRLADIDYVTSEPLGRKEGFVLVWAGMRGVVTLAAAQSLPAQTPQRDLLVLAAFVLAAGSLVIQGGTLPWFTKKLGLAGQDLALVEDERRQLIVIMAETSADITGSTALRRPDGGTYAPEVVAAVREDSERVLTQAAVTDDPAVVRATGAQYRQLRLAVIRAQRDALLDLRTRGTYSSASLGNALAILDADEISTTMRDGDAELEAPRVPDVDPIDGTPLAQSAVEGAEHQAEHQAQHQADQQAARQAEQHPDQRPDQAGRHPDQPGTHPDQHAGPASGRRTDDAARDF